MSIKTIVLFCYIAISIAIAQDTETNTQNEEEQQSEAQLLPSFAKGASTDAIKELQQIYADPYQTKQELFDRVEAWANEQGSKNAEEYYQYIQNAEDYHKKLVAKLSDAKIDTKLKEVIERILNMGEDKSKTIHDELAAVKRIQEGLSPQQLAEVGKFLFGTDQ